MATRSEEKARFKKGMAAGVFGLCTNAVLFALKTAAGVLSGSITVVADAVNNLSDAGGSAVTFTGFKLASRPADREHPFGHARYEYITTLVLSLLILAVGAVLGYTSLMKIITPEPVSASAFTYAVLGVAIAMKGVQAAFYLSVAKKISSDTLKASALDSLTDILATTAALASALVMQFADVNIDGYTGVAVSLFIMGTAIRSAVGAVSPLVGKRPPAELVDRLKEIILSHDEVIGMHDLEVHSYGEGTFFAVAHLEVAANMSLFSAHEIADDIEQDVLRDMGVHLTLHTDPIDTDDDELIAARLRTEKAVKALDGNLAIHDFRFARTVKQTKVLFDVVIPFESKVTVEQVEQAAADELASDGKNYSFNINVDRPSA